MGGGGLGGSLLYVVGQGERHEGWKGCWTLKNRRIGTADVHLHNRMTNMAGGLLSRGSGFTRVKIVK